MDSSTPVTVPAGMPRHRPTVEALASAAAPLPAPACILPRTGSLPELLRLLGLPPQRGGVGAAPGMPLPVMRVRPDAVLLHEGSDGHTLYVVRSGCFKTVRTLEDGYEQVLSFAQAGELLGFEALHGGMRQSSAVALEYSTVYALATGELRELQRDCPQFEEAVRRGLSRQLARAAEAAEMLSPVASDARLGRFILWLSARMADAGQSPHRLHLRMGRRDIASLLGLAHETISRSFTMLADSGCLRVDNREIEILDMQALRVRARNTRGTQGEAAPRRPEGRVERPAATASRWSDGPAGAWVA